MDFEDLRAVAAVASAGTFSAAARDMRLAQPALSRRIARLKRELGGRLFDRLPRRAAPTTLGEAVAAAAHRLLADLERVRADATAIATGAAGRIRLGSLAGGIPALARGLAAFQSRNPAVELELRTLEAESAVAALRARTVDLATLPGSAVEPGIGARKLARWRVVLAMRPDHPFASHKTITLAQLATQPVLLLAPEFMVTRHITDLARRTGLQLRVRLRDGTPEALLALARRGWGVGVIPDAIRLPPDVVTVPLARAGSSADFDYVIAWLDDRTLAPAAKTLVDTLVRETARFRSE